MTAVSLALWGALVLPISPQGGLAGRVTSTDGTPLAGARVTVVETRRSTLTDADGRYSLTDLPNGSYRVTFAAVGFAPQVRTVNLTADPLTLDIALRPSLVELPELQVTAAPIGSEPLTSPQPTSAVGADELRRAGGASLGDVVSGLVGVRSYSTGNAIAKPVIRGLTSNRVLILDDGQRVESQGWGDEHAPNVETADALRVEVIRGPASVLYGSEALGGVVNVIPRPLPDAIALPSFVRGNLTAAFATNGAAPEGTLAFEGATGGLGFRGSVTARESGDVQTPSGDLANSGYGMVGGSLAAGVRGSWGTASASYSGRGEEIELHEDPAEDPLATPWQRVKTDRWRVQSTLPLGQSHLDLDLGLERNDRKEYEAEDAAEDDVALGLEQWNRSATAQWHHAPLGGFVGIVGVQLRGEELEISGEESLVPAHVADNVGVYLFEQKAFGPLHLSAGVRYDHRGLEVEANGDLGVSAQTRSYDAVTGDIGLLYRVSEPMAVVLNVGRGFRAPSAFDLFANGVHEGTVRFERGDSLLGNEASLNTDLALRVQTSRLAMEVGVFYNRIDDYIFADPTGATDSASGFQIYQTSQGDARLWGFEAAAEWHPTERWHLRGMIDHTRGENRTLAQPLPGVPPMRITLEARVEGSDRGAITDPYLSLSGELHTEQTRRDPDDIATEGYGLAHLGAGATLKLGSRTVELDLQVRNLLDRSYRGFLSRYKGYADEPGRDLRVRVSTTL